MRLSQSVSWQVVSLVVQQVRVTAVETRALELTCESSEEGECASFYLSSTTNITLEFMVNACLFHSCLPKVNILTEMLFNFCSLAKYLH